MVDQVISSEFSSFAFGRSLFAGGEALLSSPVSFPGTEWIVELHSPDGTLLARLANWHSGEVTETINAVHTIRFRYPCIPGITELIDAPNILELRDLQGTRLFQRFLIQSVEDIHEEGIEMVMVTGASLIAQLNYTIVEEYSTSGALKSVKDIIDDLFTLGQVSSLHFPIRNRMREDVISSKTREIVSIKNQSVMRIIQTLWEHIGFYIYVSPQGDFYWTQQMESPANAQPFLRWGSNLPKLTSNRDYNEVYTKVIVLGADILEDDDDPEFAGEVVVGKIRAEATASSSILDQFGLKIHPIINNANLTTVGQAQDLADAVLQRVEKPQKRISAVAFDLSKAISNLDFDHTQLRIGMKINIDHPRLTGFPALIISSRRFDLANSLVQNITLSDAPDVDPWTRPIKREDEITGEIPSIEDVLDELEDKIDELTRLLLEAFNQWGIDDPPPPPYDDGKCKPFWQLEIRKLLNQLPTENLHTEDNFGKTIRCDAAPLLGWGASSPDAYGVICNKLLAFLATTFEADSVANLPMKGAAPDPTGAAINLNDKEQFPPHFGYVNTGNDEGYYGLESGGWKPLGGGGFKIYDDMTVALADVSNLTPPQMIYLRVTPFQGQKYFILGDGDVIISWTHFIQSIA